MTDQPTTVIDEPTPVEPGELAPAPRLRVSHIEVRPVLLWDDGHELTPGPPVETAYVPLSQAKAMLDSLPAQIARLAAEQTAPDETGTYVGRDGRVVQRHVTVSPDAGEGHHH